MKHDGILAESAEPRITTVPVIVSHKGCRICLVNGGIDWRHLTDKRFVLVYDCVHPIIVTEKDVDRTQHWICLVDTEDEFFDDMRYHRK